MKDGKLGSGSRFAGSGKAGRINRPGKSVAEVRTPKLDGERTRPACGFPRPRGKPRTHEKVPSIWQRPRAKRLDARRVQPHPGAGALPNFGVRVKSNVVMAGEVQDLEKKFNFEQP